MITTEFLASGDTRAVEQLYFDVRRETFSWLPEGSFRLEDFVRDTEGELVIVARVDDEIAGFIAFWPEGNFIHHLYIAHRHRGVGVGTRLLSCGLASVGRPAYLKCFDQNTHAMGFYARKGWKPSESVMGSQGAYTVLSYHNARIP